MARSTALSLLFAIALFQSPARAQHTSASEEALAQRHFTAGVEATQAQDWSAAAAAFERAHEVSGNPIILVNLGSTYAELGRLVDALEAYRAFLRQADSDRADELRPTVDVAISTLESRVATLFVTIDNLDAQEDGQLYLVMELPLSFAVACSKRCRKLGRSRCATWRCWCGSSTGITPHPP